MGWSCFHSSAFSLTASNLVTLTAWFRHGKFGILDQLSPKKIFDKEMWELRCWGINKYLIYAHIRRCLNQMLREVLEIQTCCFNIFPSFAVLCLMGQFSIVIYSLLPDRMISHSRVKLAKFTWLLPLCQSFTILSCCFSTLRQMLLYFESFLLEM